MDAFIVKEKKCTVSNLLRKFETEGFSGAPNGALKFAK